MSTQPKSFFTPEQYLEIERLAEFKSEYYRGEMFAMAGAREAHILVTGNVAGEFRQQLRTRPCRTYSNDMRINVSPTGLYTYPDVAVVCGEPRFLDDRRDTLLNPAVIVEVLSESTEAYDRGRKFGLYRSLESLTDYLLVGSQVISTELFTRQPDGSWRMVAASSLEETVNIASIGCRLSLADIYEKVDL